MKQTRSIGEVRAAFLAFFEARGHAVLPSSSLVPENDPTTLFTGSGMQPLVPYLLGKHHPAGSRLVNAQKCFRALDIEEIGDNRHTTFFEMLGNWSLGDYGKPQQIRWFWEFLTEELQLNPSRIVVTCYSGNAEYGIPKDEESAAIWKELFAQKGIDAKEVDIGSEEQGYSVGEHGGRIFFYAEKNWWSRAGKPQAMPVGEPGGPDTEVFYVFPDIPHNSQFGEQCHPNCDCGRYMELGNSVFMQYVKTETGFEKLPKQNVDYGGGLERITAALHNSPDVFVVAHAPILAFLETASGKNYADDHRRFRILADHMKAAIFLLSDGVLPSNTDQGYYVRRLLRRSIRYADTLGITQNALSQIVRPVAEMYDDQYPELLERITDIERNIAGEEEKFRGTLTRGMKEFERFGETGELSADNVFQLVTTYGFPLELILEEAHERGMKQIDEEGFRALLKQHQDRSRVGSEQKFKGGLLDHSEKTVRLHTAHHLLLKALQRVLGPSVHQRGSNITSERLRIDFNWDAKLTEEQKKEIERIVNEKIEEDIPVLRTEMKKEEAEQLGAEHEFGAKYPEYVSVYSIGTLEHAFSLEFCGGPHVERTSDLAKSGSFRILKEEAVSSGVRRIKAVLE